MFRTVSDVREKYQFELIKLIVNFLRYGLFFYLD